jgi:aminoglycoside phosphotransferase (APT) family kinase protein
VTELRDILPRLEQQLGRLGGEPTPLHGGSTNRNFRVRLGGEEYMLRLHGANTALLGIDREAEGLANAAAAGVGIAPPVAALLEGCLVTGFLALSPPGPGEVAARAADTARALRRFHDLDLQLPSTFWVPDLLAAYAAELARRGASPPAPYARAVDAAGKVARTLALTDPRPCHNDLLPGNILYSPGDGGVMLVDWEYAGMGHPYFDLGNLSVNNDFDAEADGRLLGAYHGRPATPGQRAALKLMRVLSDAREAAWGVLQAEISQLDFDFEGYASKHFERLCAAIEHPSFEEWLATAAA